LRLLVVRPASRLGWGYILALEESRVFVLLVGRSDHEMIWLRDGDEVFYREKHKIQSSKLVLTFVWNLHEFQVIDVMPKGEKFITAYHVRNISTEIVSLLDMEREVKGGWLCMRTMQGHIHQK
jgi:hypothetical protein